MPLTPGSSLGPYEVIAAIGAGGMGEVYRARDSKLNREVAIKVLPAAFAEDAERMARFQREAQTLAALNHPNIAQVYGMEGGALVMEYIPGQDLRGPLPLDEAMKIARQIGDALEAAHERGIVHRDLKPANVKVTPDGKVKVLDFGLAKAAIDESSDLANSPTLSFAATRAGVILGTASYMSPEQAKGKLVDARTDIWAYGCVLYELLTGKQAFPGETAMDAMAAIISREPDWSLLPPGSPVELLRACLQKDVSRRLRHIGDSTLVTSASTIQQTAMLPAAVEPARSPVIPWIVAGLALTIASAAGTMLWLRPKPADPVTVRFPLPYPEGANEPGSINAAQAAPSPDGRYVVLVALTDGKHFLWIRPMNSPAAHRLDKTEDADLPFWSPDGQFIAFFAENKLKKIPAAGGSPQTLCDAARQGPQAGRVSRRNSGDGGTWNADGVIVFSPGGGSALMRVLAAGGPATPVTTLDAAGGEQLHSWPQFLPDGRHFLYWARNQDPLKSGVYVQELGSSSRVLVTKSRARAAWSPPGYLLFPREGTLFAQRMDPKTFQLTGEVVSVAEEVSTSEANGRSSFAVSANGVLVYREGQTERSRSLNWYDRDGKLLGPAGKPSEYESLSLAPDEKNVALEIGTDQAGDVWIMNLASGALTKMTSNPQTLPAPGPWSPDSERLAINTRDDLLELTVASGKTRVLGKGIGAQDWLPDKLSLLCLLGRGRQMSLLPLGDNAQPQTLKDAPTVFSSRLSPNGKLLAYATGGSGQVVVATFPSFAQKRQVSIEGGYGPAWRKDGRELFFSAPIGRGIMSVEIKPGANLDVGVPKLLFPTSRPFSARGSTFAASGDGKRFLILESGRVQADRHEHLMVVVNFLSGIGKN